MDQRQSSAAAADEEEEDGEGLGQSDPESDAKDLDGSEEEQKERDDLWRLLPFADVGEDEDDGGAGLGFEDDMSLEEEEENDEEEEGRVKEQGTLPSPRLPSLACVLDPLLLDLGHRRMPCLLASFPSFLPAAAAAAADWALYRLPSRRMRRGCDEGREGWGSPRWKRPSDDRSMHRPVPDGACE